MGKVNESGRAEDVSAINLITDCLRHHMDILITEHQATGMTYVQVSRQGDENSMIAADSIKDFPSEAIEGACADALQQANTYLNTNSSDVNDSAAGRQND